MDPPRGLGLEGRGTEVVVVSRVEIACKSLMTQFRRLGALPTPLWTADHVGLAWFYVQKL